MIYASTKMSDMFNEVSSKSTNFLNIVLNVAVINHLHYLKKLKSFRPSIYCWFLYGEKFFLLGFAFFK